MKSKKGMIHLWLLLAAYLLIGLILVNLRLSIQGTTMIGYFTECPFQALLLILNILLWPLQFFEIVTLPRICQLI